jgi:hypothetical protein
MSQLAFEFEGLNMEDTDDLAAAWEYITFIEERLFSYLQSVNLMKEYYCLIDVLDTKFNCFMNNNFSDYKLRVWKVLPKSHFISFNKYIGV